MFLFPFLILSSFFFFSPFAESLFFIWSQPRCCQTYLSSVPTQNLLNLLIPPPPHLTDGIPWHQEWFFFPLSCFLPRSFPPLPSPIIKVPKGPFLGEILPLTRWIFLWLPLFPLIGRSSLSFPPCTLLQFSFTTEKLILNHSFIIFFP